MVRIILLAHSGLARALWKAATEISGPCSQLSAADLATEDSPSNFLEHVRALVMEDGGQQPILFLTDLYGGTPWRVASTLAQDASKAGRISILTGMNLAMVMEASCLITKDIDLVVLTQQVLRAAINGIRA